MKTISFYDTKPYDKEAFDSIKEQYDVEILYHETKLNKKTAILSSGCDAVVAFVNDTLDKPTLEALEKLGITLLAMRCAGYNNVNLKYAKDRFVVVRVPAYSPYAVAEHTLGMLLTLNRKLHRAYNRTREYNFSLDGLMGFDLHGKTIGVVGTGKIGKVFIDILSGFGVNILAYDVYRGEENNFKYVDFKTLCKKSDIISLHCPLTKETRHMINDKTIGYMKKGVYILNTSRGALIDSEALLEAIKAKKIGAAGLDVYEEETDIFYEDNSNEIIQDDVLARLISMPNVLVTSHQAFLTKQALQNIAETTMENIADYFEGKKLKNQVSI